MSETVLICVVTETSAQKVVVPGDVTWKQRVNSCDGNSNLKMIGTWQLRGRCRWIKDFCKHCSWLSNCEHCSTPVLFVYLQSLRQYKESHNETEILMSALSAMQDKNAHLENSLSAETRIKLDLFSALGEAKRQLEIRESKLSLWVYFSCTLLTLVVFCMLVLHGHQINKKCQIVTYLLFPIQCSA